MLCQTVEIAKNAVMDTYILSGDKKRGAVVICPGGGYKFVSEREAEPIALKFTAAGWHAFVLWYGVPPENYRQPLIELARAVALLRENADVWKIDPEKIAICGFSAGGHLAASLGVHWYQPDLQKEFAQRHKPNALILCYPVISLDAFGHIGSAKNLLGANPSEKLIQEMSLHHHVSPNTPPAFIWHTFNDSVVPLENSLLFAQQMRVHQIPFELHIYPDGPHGLALATQETDTNNIGEYPQVATWMQLCCNWLNGLFKYDL